MGKSRMIISLISIFCFILVMIVPSHAQVNLNQKDKQIYKELKQLEGKYYFELIDIKDIKKDNIKRLKFKSVKEFEMFMKKLNEKTSKNNKKLYIKVPATKEALVQNSSIKVKSSSIKLASETVYDDQKTITWWAPFSGYGFTGIACWKNVAFEYTYKFVDSKPQFVSVSNVKSYLTGITVAVTWNQTTKDVDFTTKEHTNDTVEITVSGYYVLGIDINGFEIGAKLNSKWDTCSLQLVAE